MKAQKRGRKKKKYFTAGEANATLPLLRSILRDVTELASEMNARHEQLRRAHLQRGRLGDAARAEMEEVQAEFERGRDRMHEYLRELEQLHVELKDPMTGLVDFLALHDGREVYLCWRLGEDSVSHWHELEAGFAGRQPLGPDGIEE
jgi:hypothetical protein